MTPATPARLAERPYGVLKLWPPEPRSVGRARQFPAEYLDACGLAQLTDTAELVLSELVTNALVHAHPPFGRLIATRFELLPHGVRIEVHDSSEKKPERQEVAPDAESGRGLALVDALTGGRWGVSDRDGPGKCAWAHIEVKDAGGGAKPEPRKVSKDRRRHAFPQAASELVTTHRESADGFVDIVPAVLK